MWCVCKRVDEYVSACIRVCVCVCVFVINLHCACTLAYASARVCAYIRLCCACMLYV